MTALGASQPAAGAQAALEWAAIGAAAPKLAATMDRYLTQAATFLAPLSVESADSVLRQLARWLLDNTQVRAVAEVTRDDIEDFTVWLARRPDTKGQTLAANTQRNRLRMRACSSSGSSSGTGDLTIIRVRHLQVANQRSSEAVMMDGWRFWWASYLEQSRACEGGMFRGGVYSSFRSVSQGWRSS